MKQCKEQALSLRQKVMSNHIKSPNLLQVGEVRSAFQYHQTCIWNFLLHLLSHPQGRFRVLVAPYQQGGLVDFLQQRCQIVIHHF